MTNTETHESASHQYTKRSLPRLRLFLLPDWPLVRVLFAAINYHIKALTKMSKEEYFELFLLLN